MYIVFTILLKALVGSINKEGDGTIHTFSQYCATLFFIDVKMILDLSEPSEPARANQLKFN